MLSLFNLAVAALCGFRLYQAYVNPERFPKAYVYLMGFFMVTNLIVALI